MERKKQGWEDLRKEALYLENEIDAKLATYSKLGTSIPAPISESDIAPLINHEDRQFESLSDEIQRLLTKLKEVNDEMATISTTTPGLSSAASMHTVQRHREILQDYSQEFRKTQTNLRSRREREELLQGVRQDVSNKSPMNRRMDMYIKEHDHLKSSERLIDEQISIAIETKENLVSQRAAFKMFQSRVNDITSRFPAINNLIQKINLKKRKDSIIVGIVVGICTFLIIMYAIH